jgi:hypothetical protein
VQRAGDTLCTQRLFTIGGRRLSSTAGGLPTVGRWTWLVIWLIVLAATIATVVIAEGAHLHPWSGVTTARMIFYQREECELIDLVRFFLQCANFWSNFAYLALGLLIVTHDSRFGQIIGATFLLLAFGSGWFHGTLSEWGQTTDMAGVYCGLLAIASYGFVEFLGVEHDTMLAKSVIAAAIVLGIIAAVLRVQVPLFSSDTFTPILVVAVLVFGVILGARLPGSKHHLLWPGVFAVVAGLVALVFKFTDGDDNLLAKHHRDYALCTYQHESLFQGHAIWHLLSAFMFLCMFEYFRSLGSRSRPVFPWR